MITTLIVIYKKTRHDCKYLWIKVQRLCYTDCLIHNHDASDNDGDDVGNCELRLVMSETANSSSLSIS